MALDPVEPEQPPESAVVRVLKAAERALIVSLFEVEPCILHVNPAMKRFLPGLHEDMPIGAFSERMDMVYEVRNRVPFGMRVVDLLEGPGSQAARHMAALGGLWILGTHLPVVEAVPPSALVTFHTGNRFHEADAWRVHRPIAFATSLALELDEARRELAVGVQMVSQANNRLDRLTGTLVEHQDATYRALVEEGISSGRDHREDRGTGRQRTF